MKDLIEHMARSLVADADAVVVTETVVGDSIELNLKVAPDDMGKVIGKQGRVAKAMRLVMKAAAAKEGKRCNLDIDD